MALCAGGALAVAVGALGPPGAWAAHRHCRVPRGSRAWAQSAKAIVYADGPFANPDTHNTRVVACWRPSGRRTPVGYDYRFDEDDPTSRFAIVRLAGRWLAVDRVRVNLFAATGSSPIPQIAVLDLRRGKTRYCVAPPVGDFLSALAVDPDGSAAWISNSGAAGAAPPAAVQAYDRDGLRTLYWGLRGRLSTLSLAARRASWRDGQTPGSASVLGPPRPGSCPSP